MTPLTKFHNTLDIWIQELEKYDLKRLNLQPGEHSWSLGQVYIHLLEETHWYFEQIDVCLQEPGNQEKEMSEEARQMFANDSFPDIIIKNDLLVPNTIKPPEDMRVLLNDLCHLKDTATAIWRRIGNATETGKSAHPGHRFFSPVEWFRFAELHLRHHLRQKARIEAFLVRYPATETH